MKPFDKDIELIIREALSRHEEGREEHGELDLTIEGTLSMRQSKSYWTASITVCFRY